jgi:hypothetical protein
MRRRHRRGSTLLPISAELQIIVPLKPPVVMNTNASTMLRYELRWGPVWSPGRRAAVLTRRLESTGRKLGVAGARGGVRPWRVRGACEGVCALYVCITTFRRLIVVHPGMVSKHYSKAVGVAH